MASCLFILQTAIVVAVVYERSETSLHLSICGRFDSHASSITSSGWVIIAVDDVLTVLTTASTATVRTILGRFTLLHFSEIAQRQTHHGAFTCSSPHHRASCNLVLLERVPRAVSLGQRHQRIVTIDTSDLDFLSKLDAFGLLERHVRHFHNALRFRNCSADFS